MADRIEIIAEVGWNFLGDMELAKRMIHKATEAGADYVKFQTWKVERLIPGPWDDDGRKQIYEKAELSENDHFKLRDECKKAGIQFLTSCFCIDDLDFIRLLTDQVKIPSPEASNPMLVFKAQKMFNKVFMSTGASQTSEWEKWMNVANITIMHCISSYPCEPVNFHMEKLKLIKKSMPYFGFSGHAPTIWDAVMAISLGASVVEKHFTLDNDLLGRDNKFALLPDKFKQIREYADAFVGMQTIHSLADILPCEKDYRKYHKGRWGG
tara:strand:+ start:6823 stop:7623 length:801 start_codon:yes stop_codon:yes gene_type:complete